MAGLAHSRGNTNSASSWVLGWGQALTFFHYLLDVLLLILLLLSVEDLRNVILRFRDQSDLSTITTPLFFPCGFSVGGGGGVLGVFREFSLLLTLLRVLIGSEIYRWN